MENNVKCHQIYVFVVGKKDAVISDSPPFGRKFYMILPHSIRKTFECTFEPKTKKKINKITERKNKYVLEDCMQIGSTNSRSRFDSGLLPQKYPIDVDLLSVSHFPYVCILCTNNILWLLDKCETLFFHIFPFAFVVVAVECQLHE